MNGRERLKAMVRTEPGSTTIWPLAEVESALDALDAEVRTEALNDAADRIERRAAQMGGVWLRADQVCDALRRLAQPAEGGGRP